MAHARGLSIVIAAILALSSVVLVSAVRAATVTITIGASVQPASVSVAPGTTVTFANVDGDRHRVRSTSGPVEFDSGNLEPGQSFDVTLTAIGTYAYRDERNPEQSAYWGTVVVSLAPTSAPSATNLPPGVTPAPPAATPSTATVRMAGRVFRPSLVSITEGGSVTFINDDDRSHTVTSTSRAFDSGTMAAGSSYTRTFPAAGTFGYLCSLHPDMTGTVVVGRANGATAPPAPPPAPTPAIATPVPTIPPGATQPPPTAATASILDFAFSPAILRVTVGSTITWRNAGVAPHTVTATDGSFDSGMLQAGGVFTRRFERAGTIPFYCIVHPQMTGTVVVSVRDGGGSSPGASAAPDLTAPESAAPPGSVATGPPLAGQDIDPPPGSSGPDNAASGTTGTPASSPGPLAGAALALLVAVLIAAAVILFAYVLAGVPGMSERAR